MTLYFLFYALFLIIGASTLGIGPKEAEYIYTAHHWLHYIVAPFVSKNPNEFIVRLPIVCISLLNLALYAKIAPYYLKRKEDRFLALFIYSMLPGVIATSVLINKAPIIIFLTLIFIYMYHKYVKWLPYFSLVLLLFDQSFAILFLAVSTFYWYKKEKIALYYFLLFVMSLWIYGFDVGGKPKNYFLDTIAVLAAIFSPLVFLYYFYTVYRILVKEKKNLLWFLSGVSFLFALVLSFRQKIDLINFAPFMVVGAVLMVRTFYASYRVRLEKYRKRLKIAFFIVIFSLILNDFFLIFNQTLFIFEEPKHHFAYKYYFAKSLANALYQNNISCIDAKDEDLQLQLRFYGIQHCRQYSLSPFKSGISIELDFPFGKKEVEFVTNSYKKTVEQIEM
ncbi:MULTISPECIES: hypothetical protein [unclassified Nitratiruptor]|uniref:hypothetical protein n=1 Tax=unclassified Nitratiruptor TaxID=2624044 RepID=UPI001916C497|nr:MULTISPECIES: hypothetical protein [unclassified Nitratiruptor]BCD59951.1 arginine/ornithine antiporter ArcD [Nitratiruptor sp. YY08-10]BCD63874.1 arginine/ornithine antiporter ArcD [Nitratiruptor sp. YY08-14]